MTVVVVDAENVRRSTWPNLSKDDLVRRCRDWAERQEVELLVVFDGSPPEAAEDLVSSGSRSADERIVELAAGLDDYWLVTSDRALRDTAGLNAARVIGGGSFLRALGV